jgi:hypothetical protein
MNDPVSTELVTQLVAFVVKDDKLIRKDMRASAVFIRYVHRHFDQSQISKFAAIIDFAFSEKVSPTRFKTWVTDNKGFTGVYALSVKASKGDDTSAADLDERVALSLGFIRGGDIVATIEMPSWEDHDVVEMENLEVRVLFASKGTDGVINLKDSAMSEENTKKVMSIHWNDCQARTKPGGRKVKTTKDERERAKINRRNLRTEKVAQEQMLSEYNFELKQASRAGKLFEVEQIKAKIEVAATRIDLIKMMLDVKPAV